MGKPAEKSSFFSKPNARKNDSDSNKVEKKKKSYENLSKRTSRKEMIAKREKFKLKNNLNKQLRYERKHQPNAQATTRPTQRRENESASKAPLTSFKKAQLEYEKKQEEKRKRQEVSPLFFYIEYSIL